MRCPDRIPRLLTIAAGFAVLGAIVLWMRPQADLYAQPYESVWEHRDAIVAVLAEEPLEESAWQLVVEDQQYFAPGYHSGRHTDQLDIEILLSTVRFLKVRTELARLPDERRRAFLEDWCERILQRRHETFEISLRMYEEPGQPKNTRSMLSEKLGLSAALLLAGEHGYRDLIVDVVARSRTIEDAVLEKISNDRSGIYPGSLGPAIVASGRLLGSVELNALAQAVMHDATVTPGARRRAEAALSELPIWWIRLTPTGAHLSAAAPGSLGWTQAEDAHGPAVFRFYRLRHEDLHAPSRLDGVIELLRNPSGV